jgi:hypothetical protein
MASLCCGVDQMELGRTGVHTEEGGHAEWPLSSPVATALCVE